MRILHVLNGDAARAGFERSGVAGEVVVWADVLYEGPVPCDVGTGAARRVRAEYLAAAGYGVREAIAESLRQADDHLGRWFEFDEVVFWLEHDLFDQLLLARHLTWLARHDGAPGRSRLISVDRHLGALTPHGLSALFPDRMPIDAGRLALGIEAWRAVCADDPASLVRLAAREPAPELPYLADALRRLVEEYPALADGLSRSERQLLRAVKAGQDTLSECFRATQAMEERAFMSDLSFATVARGLAHAPTPLVTLDFNPDGAAPLAAFVALTDFGRAVLAATDDHVRVNGIDRWIGGVHLSGHGPMWRWDGAALVWA
jgi:hypothetical protein